MKALKEKRISLRSLLRRSLVILSLLALVFVSCGDSSSDSSDTDNGRVPLRIEVIADPTQNSYEGLPVNLAGLKAILVYNTDATDYELVTDFARLSTYPATAVGYDNGFGVWTPLNKYQLWYNTGKEVLKATISLGSGTNTNSVIPIVREDTSIPSGGTPTDSIDSNKWTDDFYWAQGLQLTGLTTHVKNKLYVDDYPDFSGLTLEAHYADATKFVIPWTGDVKWQIRPRYNNGMATGNGDLIVTIGECSADVLECMGFFPGANFVYKGVSVSTPLTEVWHVTKLEVVPEPDLWLFYWQADDNAFWTEKLIDANLHVTYSNGGTKDFSVKDALRMNEIWYNANPSGDVDIPFDVVGVWDSRAPTVTSYAKDTNSKISLYYRGVRTQIKVPVLVKLSALAVVSESGGQIEADLRPRDNDYGGMNAKTFSKNLRVTATFTNNDGSVSKDLVLAFDENLKEGGVEYTATGDGTSDTEVFQGHPNVLPTKDAAAAAAGLYSMTYGNAPWWDGTAWKQGALEPDPSAKPARTQGAWGNVNDPKYNNANKALTVYYAPPNNIGGVGTTKALKQTINIDWKNIMTR